MTSYDHGPFKIGPFYLWRHDYRPYPPDAEFYKWTDISRASSEYKKYSNIVRKDGWEYFCPSCGEAYDPPYGLSSCPHCALKFYKSSVLLGYNEVDTFYVWREPHEDA